MSDVLLSSREVERMLDIPASTLRWTANSLGHGGGTKGVARKWSLGELTSLVIVQRLVDRGFSVQAAANLARVFDEATFGRLVADENAGLWAVATPTGAGHFEITLADTSEEAIDAVLAARDPIVLDLRAMFTDAFVLVAEARRASR